MWWRDAVLYQIYPRSFADTNGDGIGDIPGITSRLDHLSWLGVDAIWLSPVMPSPNTDWGYDVSDYCDIHPELGTLADFDLLVTEAGRRGIRVLNDLVPNHTSDANPWFVEARAGRDARHRDWYVWVDPPPDGSVPNNWVSAFGGPAWTLDPSTGQYYLHNFLPTQPDLNWWNDEVRDAFDEILRFWFDRGVAGFRIDVCNGIVKDAELRDNPPATDDDPPGVRIAGVRPVYNTNRPEAHDVLRRWRRIANGYEPERLLLGETYVWDLDALATFYGADDELQLAFNFPFVFSRLDANRMRTIVEAMQELLPEHAWPGWTGSNHDAGRLATRWCGGDERKVRCALMMLMTLRGTPVLYYGDEIGLPDTTLEREQLRDPVGVRFFPAYAGRDPGRTPMHWTGGEGAGFTSPGTRPWLPLGDASACNASDQRSDHGSVLHLCRDLIALRRSTDSLRSAPYASRPAPEGVWAYRRGDRHLVALNLSDEDAKLDEVTGTVSIATDRARDGQSVSGGLSLEPWEGVVVEAG